MLHRAAVRDLPTISFGPFRLLEAVPWLMLSAAMRVMAFRGGAFALLALIVGNIALLLAFLIVVRRMIEFSDGRTELGRQDFAEQLGLAARILGYVVVLLLIMAVIVLFASGEFRRSPLGWRTALQALLGFDGIAFDQWSNAGRLWSSALAAIVLLMAIRGGDGGNGTNVSLIGALRELVARSFYLVPAIAAARRFRLALIWHRRRYARSCSRPGYRRRARSFSRTLAISSSCSHSPPCGCGRRSQF
jgi:hypothetical protein